MNPVISREYVEKNYIHKNKLIAKKQELEAKCETELLTTWLESQIDIIDELLEETEDENNNTNNDSFKKEQSTDINK